VHTNAARDWRILIQDEPGDIVVTVQHRHTVNGKEKWDRSIWLDQSTHDDYHAHLSENRKETVTIGANLSKDEKLHQDISFLKSIASEKRIRCGNDYLMSEDIEASLIKQVENKQANNGTTANSVSISVTAAIITLKGHPPNIAAKED